MGSSIMTILDRAEKHNDVDESVQSPDYGSLAIARSGLGAGFTHPNDSNATTLISPPLRLTLRAESEHSDHPATHSAPATPDLGSHSRDEVFSAEGPQVHVDRQRRDLKRSHSSPGIQHRISQKLFGTPTIVRRSELRSRPSIYSLPAKGDQSSWMTTQLSSTPSTYNSDSGSTRNGVHTAMKSTPPTSDTTPSPRSVTHNEGIAIADQDRGLWFTHNFSTHARLTPIPEGAIMPTQSIVTIEATATAKIFFETHFNSLLNRPDPRQSRRWQLEHRLRELQLPAPVEYRTRTAWAKHESHNLRLYRTMKATALSRKRKDAIAIGGYEVVKILGKGSFGVVRLVREKRNIPVAGRSSSAVNLIKHPTKSALKSTAKEALAPIAYRKVNLKQGQERSVCDEGHSEVRYASQQPRRPSSS